MIVKVWILPLDPAALRAMTAPGDKGSYSPRPIVELDAVGPRRDFLQVTVRNSRLPG